MMSAGPIDVEWSADAFAHLNRFADFLQNDAPALTTIVGAESLLGLSVFRGAST
jgi:hypothetical protein